MSEYNYQSMWNLSLELLNKVNADPYCILKTKFSCLSIAFLLSSLIELLISAFLVYANSKNDVISFVSFADATVVLMVPTVCVINICVYRSSIVTLLENVKQFWPIVAREEYWDVKLCKRFRFWYRFMKTLIHIMAINCFGFVFLPLITKKKVLPFFGIVPENNWLYFSLYVHQIVVMYPTWAVSTGFYVLFISSIILLAIQFDIVKESFRNIKLETNLMPEKVATYKRIKETIEHHIFVISFAKSISRIFALFLTTQFVIQTLFMSVTLVLGFSEKTNIILTVESISFLANSIIVQFFLSCMGEIMQETSADIGNGIYDSGWHLQNDKHIHFCALMVIMISQKPLYLSGYGLFNANFPTFVHILQFIWSVYTLFKTLQEAA